MSRPKRSWWAAGLALSAALAAVAALIWWLPGKVQARPAQTAAQENAERCLSCHEMQKQVELWRDSSHKETACLDCHADPGMRGIWQQAVDTVRRRYVHVKGGVDETNISTDVPNERCLRCHAEQMPYVMEDYQPPAMAADGTLQDSGTEGFVKLPLQPDHDRHLSQVPGATCTSCHNQVGHRPQSEQAYEQASHQTCDSCHERRQVSLIADSSLTCTTCHEDMVPITPQDHDASWRQNHGQAALKDATSCSPCHTSQDLPAVQTVATGARAGADPSAWLRPRPAGPVGDACRDCHQTTMPHPSGFMNDHGRDFLSNPEGCARCHLTQGQGFDLKVRVDPQDLLDQPACLECHTRTNPHPPSQAVVDTSPLAPVRVLSHPTELPTAPACQTCHNQNNTQVCARCHQGPSWHPEDYAQTHRQTAYQQGVDGCRTCHNTPDACARCHRDVGIQ